ncbi:hypothetical protein HK405_005673 [Cladochytrium tenue]|nr:hypothetical protein HK405_005673 [Cladochytrium tenue]
MGATLRIFDAVRVPFDYKFIDMGKDIYLKGYSNGMTPEAKDTVERLGILFKGPMETPKGAGVKSINVTARKVWSTFANKRVFRTLPGVETVYSRAGINIDLTLLRENIEDTYGGIEHYQTNDVAQTRRLITRPGSLQIHKMAFEANIHKITDGLFLSTFYEVAKQYPSLKADDTIVDDLAMKLVMNPTSFDVVVLPNLQGDIISDLCAGLVGGLGMAPSANLGERISIYEAVHGTAPDIAGKKMANPTALLMSGLMMLRQLGLTDKADAVHRGLEAALASGDRTRDLAQLPGRSPLGTDAFADAVVHHIAPAAKAAPVSFADIKYAAPIRPATNPMLSVKADRCKEKEKTVGTDFFVDSDLAPAELADLLKATVDSVPGRPPVELTMISNRGTQVWPTGSLFTELVNHYRCRLENKSGEAVAETDLLALISAVSKKVRVCSLEMLLVVDGKKGYSLAQGQ